MLLLYESVPAGVSPAHAGIDHGSARETAATLSFPRPRGDRPRPAVEGYRPARFPPPTRG